MNLKTMFTAAIAAALVAACSNTESDKTSENTTTKDSVTTPVITEPEKTDIKTVEVPVATKTHFEAKYPQASNVVWTRYEVFPSNLEWDWYGWPALDTNDYVAYWGTTDNPYWVWYDQDGNWIGAVETINVSSVPAAVNKKLNTEFTGYTVNTVNKENDKNRVAYEISMTKGNDKLKVLIDEKGNVMKKKGTVDGEKVKEKNI
jgi:hypothetical protein